MPVNTITLDARVKAALAKAEEAGRRAADEFRATAERDSVGCILDTCGYAYVATCETRTAVTRTLRRFGNFVDKGRERHYLLFGLDFRTDNEQSISLNENVAEAAAAVLTEELGQKFFVLSRID